MSLCIEVVVANLSEDPTDEAKFLDDVERWVAADVMKYLIWAGGDTIRAGVVIEVFRYGCR